MAIVLVVDDDADTLSMLTVLVEGEGHTVLTATAGPAALDLLRRERPDLMILDLMLPGMDGLEVCRRAREFSYLPILMLTAKGSGTDRIVGLEVGADDYLAKPAEPGEIRARVRALLRRALYWQSETARQREVLVRGSLRLDPERFEVTLEGSLIETTRLEFDLLYCLARHPGIVYSRERLIELVWGEDEYLSSRAVDVHVSRLRKKVERDPANPEVVVTVHGVGYKLQVPVS
jgi:DNA-binding response OmpR family regulator